MSIKDLSSALALPGFFRVSFERSPDRVRHGNSHRGSASMRHENVLQMQKLARGVYWEAATVDGNPCAIAVDSGGDVIKRMIVEDFTWKKGQATVRFLWNFLNMKDPATTAGNVRPLFALPAPVQLVRDPYDPYAEEGVPGKLRKPW
jgi:hypothetical protein